MFFGREDYLNELNALWSKRVASLVTCRGRRRIGKSTLIAEFARRSKARFIEIVGEAPRVGMKNRDQLESVERQLRDKAGYAGDPIMDWYGAFKALNAAIDNRKTVVLLDEISWMGQYDRSFAGELKTAWDVWLKKHDHLILVLCGSVSTWISENILNNTGFVGRASMNLTVKELSLRECVKFWGAKARRMAPRDILDVLSVTGGVPRYLEEVNPCLSAGENIRRMCFAPHSLLRDDFSKIFNTVFGENAVAKRAILLALADAPRGLSEIADEIGYGKSGRLSQHLEDLKVAGFISEDVGLNPATGKPSKLSKFRISDNYTRFFLKYILPNGNLIDEGTFSFHSLDALEGWNAVLGIQFENLVRNNLSLILPKLGMERVLLKSAAPYVQHATSRQKGCQIDLLLQSERMICVVEIKRRREIGPEVEKEVEAKIRALKIPRNVTTRTALVYDGILSPRVDARGYFDFIVSVDDFIREGI